jgi:LAS seventeen-binding protein 5
MLTFAQELPLRKVNMTQAQSKVVKETENPFGDEEDDAPSAGPSSSASTPKSQIPYGQTAGTVQSFSHAKSGSGSGSFFGSSKDKKKKEKDKKGKRGRPFNLEAEKEQMKSNLADANMAATNLMNSLRSINRETERISDNAAALERFEQCKQLRRKILRYVRFTTPSQGIAAQRSANSLRFIMSRARSGWEVSWRPTTSSSSPS